MGLPFIRGFLSEIPGLRTDHSMGSFKVLQMQQPACGNEIFNKLKENEQGSQNLEIVIYELFFF